MKLFTHYLNKKRISATLLTALILFLFGNSTVPAFGQGYFGNPEKDHFNLGLTPLPDTFFFHTLADMNGDNALDLFILTTTRTLNPCFTYVNLDYYVNTGTSACPDFQHQPLSDPFGIPDTVTGLSFVDIDGDNDLDLFSLVWCQSKILFLENTGTATLPEFGNSLMLTNPFGIDPTGVISANATFGDMDNDGDYDLFINGTGPGNFRYQENTGTATSPSFAVRQTNPYGLQVPYNPNGPIWSACLDWDCDGDLDLLNTLWTSSPTSIQEVFYYENISTDPSTPSFGMEVATGDSFLVSVLGDLDGDGDMDAIYLDNYYQNIAQHPGCVTPPVADFTHAPNGWAVQFTDASTAMGTSCSPVQWFWDFGDGSTSIAQNPGYTYTQDGPYQVCLVVEDVSGTDTICKTIMVVNSIDNLADKSFFSLYPNPSSDFLYLEWKKEASSQEVKIEVFDVLGQLIRQDETRTNQQVIRMDIAEFPVGLYWVKVTAGGQFFTKKVLKVD